MRTMLLLMIQFYRWFISPLQFLLFPQGCCRFNPVCSHYAQMAIERHGAAKGFWLTLKRIGRCHPWHEGGNDPVPERMESKNLLGAKKGAFLF